jgi:hypothetical protein
VLCARERPINTTCQQPAAAFGLPAHELPPLSHDQRQQTAQDCAATASKACSTPTGEANASTGEAALPSADTSSLSHANTLEDCCEIICSSLQPHAELALQPVGMQEDAYAASKHAAVMEAGTEKAGIGTPGHEPQMKAVLQEDASAGTSTFNHDPQMEAVLHADSLSAHKAGSGYCGESWQTSAVLEAHPTPSQEVQGQAEDPASCPGLDRILKLADVATKAQTSGTADRALCKPVLSEGQAQGAVPQQCVAEQRNGLASSMPCADSRQIAESAPVAFDSGDDIQAPGTSASRPVGGKAEHGKGGGLKQHASASVLQHDVASLRCQVRVLSHVNIRLAKWQACVDAASYC